MGRKDVFKRLMELPATFIGAKRAV